ncbi:DNA-binding beta-propeller fold protein YncE [Rhodopirellula rubra]|uniref:DNA-binding beta-propeller fold protein YncE n=1 Tax=Aporhodopirellula rubra TaxID=980271 RepID=A0A7W5DZ43_9BACT|nr:dockerin type I domain-containing protein [Aporhodopirellula rubra]MBB3207180.1 DNA-binding beta-propeller fold protein YncE [Aporhodopirellula rubra]
MSPRSEHRRPRRHSRSEIRRDVGLASTKRSPRIESLESRVVMAAGIDIDITIDGRGTENSPGPSVAPGTYEQWDFAVTNTGDRPIVELTLRNDGGAPFQPADDVVPEHVVDESVSVAATGELLATFDDQKISKMVVDPIRPRVYMTSADEDEVLVLDTSSLEIIETIQINSQPHGLGLSPDAQRLYVTSYDVGDKNGSVVEIDLESGNQKTITITGQPIDVKVGHHDRLYVLTNSQLQTIDRVLGNEVATPIETGFENGELAINPQRDRLYVARIGTGVASLSQYSISAPTPAVLWQSTPGTAIGSNGQDLAISHDGSFVSYAAGNGQGGYRIAKFQTDTMQPIGFFETGMFPREVSFSSDDAVAYTVSRSGIINTWDTTTFADSGSMSVQGEARELIVDTSGQDLIAAFDDELRVYSTGRSAPLNIGDVDANGVMDPGETWHFRADGLVKDGLVQTTTEVRAVDARGELVIESVDSHYFGRFVAVEMSTQLIGRTTDSTGLYQVQLDEVLVWQQSIANVGARGLTNLELTWGDADSSETLVDVMDSYVSGDSDADGIFDADETWVFEHSEVAHAGEHRREWLFDADSYVDVSEPPTPSLSISASSSSVYFGVEAAVSLTVLLNQQSLSDSVAVEIDVNQPMVWTYEVRSAGNSPLSGVMVVDDAGTEDPSDDVTATLSGGDTNNNGELDLDETWVFTYDDEGDLGLFLRGASVTATDPAGGVVADTQEALYVGVGAQASVELHLLDLTGNPLDGSTEETAIRAGDEYQIQMVIANTGTLPLAAPEWADGGGGFENASPTRISPDANNDGILSVGETWEYRSQVLVAGDGSVLHQIVATNQAVTGSGTPLAQPPITSESEIHYFGVNAVVETVVAGSGQRVTLGDENLFLSGTSVQWTYEVTNAGNVPVTDVSVRVDVPSEPSSSVVSVSLPPTTETGLSPRGSVMAEFAGFSVQEMVAHPTLPYMFVSVTNQDRVVVINTLTLSIEASVETGRGPSGMALSPDGSRLYVANSQTQNIGVIDVETFESLPGISIAQIPRDVEVGADGRLFVLGHLNLMQLSPVTGEAIGETLPVSVSGGEIKISPDRTRLYYADANSTPASLYQIDISSTPARVVWQSEENVDLSGSNGQSLALSPDGQLIAYATAVSSKVRAGETLPEGIRIVTRNASDMSVAGLFVLPNPPGSFAQEITFSPDGRFVYTTSESGTVSVFGAATYSQTGTINTSGLASEMTIDASGRFLFAAMGDRLTVLSTGRATATLNQGDTNVNHQLDPGETWVYGTTSVVSDGRHVKNVVVTGTDTFDGAISDTAFQRYDGAQRVDVNPMVAGASLGGVTGLADSLMLSDDRFEVVNGRLRLKSDQHVTIDDDEAVVFLRSGPEDSDIEKIFVLDVSAVPAWQNTSSVHDVNDDGYVTALDALMIINRLATSSDTELGVRQSDVNVFYDTNGDGHVTAVDALRVINSLNVSQVAPTSEPSNPDRDNAWDWQADKTQRAIADLQSLDVYFALSSQGKD